MELCRVAALFAGTVAGAFAATEGNVVVDARSREVTITMPACMWRLKCAAYFSDVVAMPAARPNSESFANINASS